jgi:ABC-type transport system involved in cytochrome bd biosynthesis fused ATPase/permease subunit
MLRFLAGILMVQAASVALVLVVGRATADWDVWLPILVALGVIALVAAFWFSMAATGMRRGEIDRLRAEFARERESLRVQAEREKTRLVRKSQKDVAAESRRAESRANRKVALAVTAASAAGLVMLMTSTMALGLALLAGTGGALGGYLAGRKWLPGRQNEGGIRRLEPSRRWLRLGSSADVKPGD